jgi:hypothetical protein
MHHAPRPVTPRRISFSCRFPRFTVHPGFYCGFDSPDLRCIQTSPTAFHAEDAEKRRTRRKAPFLFSVSSAPSA